MRRSFSDDAAALRGRRCRTARGCVARPSSSRVGEDGSDSNGAKEIAERDQRVAVTCEQLEIAAEPVAAGGEGGLDVEAPVGDGGRRLEVGRKGHIGSLGRAADDAETVGAENQVEADVAPG